MHALVLLIAACGLPDAAQQLPLEAAPEPPAALAAPPAAAITASVEVLAPRELPDGLGGTVAAEAPVALSLGGGWGGRALDPALVIGERRFTDYDHPAPGVLRYTLPDRALLEADGIRLQWGEEDAVDLGPAVREALR